MKRNHPILLSVTINYPWYRFDSYDNPQQAKAEFVRKCQDFAKHIEEHYRDLLKDDVANYKNEVRTDKLNSFSVGFEINKSRRFPHMHFTLVFDTFNMIDMPELKAVSREYFSDYVRQPHCFVRKHAVTTSRLSHNYTRKDGIGYRVDYDEDGDVEAEMGSDDFTDKI